MLLAGGGQGGEGWVRVAHCGHSRVLREGGRLQWGVGREWGVGHPDPVQLTLLPVPLPASPGWMLLPSRPGSFPGVASDDLCSGLCSLCSLPLLTHWTIFLSFSPLER